MAALNRIVWRQRVEASYSVRNKEHEEEEKEESFYSNKTSNFPCFQFYFLLESVNFIFIHYEELGTMLFAHNAA